jgi:hypothetical protein
MNSAPLHIGAALSFREQTTMSNKDLKRATTGYDDAHERALGDAILTTIVKRSMVDGVMVIRTGEIAAALTGLLAMTLALSPSATRTPAAIREISDRFRQKLEHLVRQAERDPALFDFKERVFRNDDRERGGRA